MASELFVATRTVLTVHPKPVLACGLSVLPLAELLDLSQSGWLKHAQGVENLWRLVGG